MRPHLALVLLSTLGIASAQSTPVWVGTWAAAPFDGDPWHTIPTLVDSTLREVVHTSIPGKALRVRFTNEFGTQPLTIDAATVALSTSAANIDAASLHKLAFHGKGSIVIPPGAAALSDPVEMATPAFANLAISLYLPLQQVSDVTMHSSA